VRSAYLNDGARILNGDLAESQSKIRVPLLANPM